MRCVQMETFAERSNGFAFTLFTSSHYAINPNLDHAFAIYLIDIEP
jgi:hypothetical protein